MHCYLYGQLKSLDVCKRKHQYLGNDGRTSLKPVSPAAWTSWTHEMLHVVSLDIILSRERIQKMQIRLSVSGCAGWSALLFVVCSKISLSRVEALLKAGVGYIRQGNLQFHHFLHCNQAVNIYRSLSLI